MNPTSELTEEFLDAFISGIYWNVEHGEYPRARRKILDLIEQQTKGRNMVPEDKDPTELAPDTPEKEPEATQPQAADGSAPEPGPHTAEVPASEPVPAEESEKSAKSEKDQTDLPDQEKPGCDCQPE